MRKRNKWLVGIAVVWVGASLIPLERENPPVTGDLVAPPEVTAVLHRACYDCHSNETDWRWYSYVAPVNFLVTQDVAGGRHRLNFSRWGDLDASQQEFKKGEIREMVDEGEMPPLQYRIARSGGRLSDADVAVLRDWCGAAADDHEGDEDDEDHQDDADDR